MVDGRLSPMDQGFKVAILEVDERLLVVLFFFTLFIISFGAGKTHIALVDAIFTEILLARGTFNQFIGLDFRPT